MGAEDDFARLRARYRGRPGAHRPRRPADDVWDALVAVCGWETPHDNDKTSRGRLGRVTRELVAMEATAADVRERASQYRRRMPNVELTPEALLKHWASCVPPRRLLGSHMQPHPIGDEAQQIGEAIDYKTAMAQLQSAMTTRSDEMRGK